LALFGRRPIERVAAIVFTGIQKPAQERNSWFSGETIGHSRLWTGHVPGFLGAYAFRAKASRENIGAIDTCNHDFRFLAIGSPV